MSMFDTSTFERYIQLHPPVRNVKKRPCCNTLLLFVTVKDLSSYLGDLLYVSQKDLLIARD